MPVTATPVKVTGLRGFVWKIDNEDELARLVARIYVGHARHVENILRKLRPNVTHLPVTISAAKGAKKLLAITKDRFEFLSLHAELHCMARTMLIGRSLNGKIRSSMRAMARNYVVMKERAAEPAGRHCFAAMAWHPPSFALHRGMPRRSASEGGWRSRRDSNPR